MAGRHIPARPPKETLMHKARTPPSIPALMGF